MSSSASSLKLSRSLFKYTSCYCEENIYKLMETFRNFAASSSSSSIPSSCPSKNLPGNFQNNFNNFKVLFLSNQNQTFPIWYQRAGQTGPNGVGFCCWDYHVIAIDIEEKLIYDLDSTLKVEESSQSSLSGALPSENHENPTFPLKIETYFKHLLQSDTNFAPQFHQKIHLIDADFYLKNFASDRSHMINEKTGQYNATPPDYDCIVNNNGETNNLDEFRKFGYLNQRMTEKGEVFTREEFYKKYGPEKNSIFSRFFDKN